MQTANRKLRQLTFGRALALTVAFGLIAALPHLLLTELRSGDETRVAGIAVKMLLSKDWLVPRLGDRPFLEYPPLCYQIMAGSFRLFGITDAAARLPSVLFAVGGMVLTLLFGLKLKLSPGFALLGALMLGSSAQYYGNTGKCTVDMLLAFFILLAVYAFYGFTAAEQRRARSGWLCLAWLGFSGGVCTKGLIGVALPGVVLGFWLLAGDLRDRKFSFRNYAALALLGLAALVPAAFWYRHIGLSLGESAVREALITQNFGRFSGHQGDHVTPCYYYLTKLPMLFQPYLLILLPSLWYGVRQCRKKEADGILLPVIFVLLPFLLLSVSAGKRVVYLLMLAAPCALVCAAGVRAAAEKLSSKRLTAFAAAHLTALTLGGALLLAAGNLIYNFSIEPESLRPCFERCRDLEQQGFRIKLAAPAERTVGAAVYYLRRTLPEIGKPAGFPEPGEAHLCRSRRTVPGEERFADKHYLLVGRLGQNGEKTSQILQNKGRKP